MNVMLSLIRSPLVTPRMSRSNGFWRWLGPIFNKPDWDRVQKVGPDRSCGEWLLKNGAKLKWVGARHIVNDFHGLSGMGTHGCLLEEVIAEDSSISSDGFIHFRGCKHIKKVIFDNCEYIDDNALEELEYLEESPLQHLTIISCHYITDAGLRRMPDMKHLQTLTLGNLKGVERILLCADDLHKQFPQAKLRVNGNEWNNDAHTNQSPQP